MGFKAANGKTGRKPNPRAIDVLKDRLEADLDRWLKPLEKALDAKRGLVVGDGAAARIEYVVDHRTRLAAVSQALDRSYGKPTIYQDVTARTDESSVDSEIATLLAEMDGKAPAQPPADEQVRHLLNEVDRLEGRLAAKTPA